MAETRKAGFGKQVEGRLPGGSIVWKVEDNGTTIRLDSEEVPEFWAAIHADRIIRRKRPRQTVSAVMIVRRSGEYYEEERGNMIRHMTEEELKSMGIELTSQCTHGKTNDYPSLLQAWDSLCTGEGFNKVLYLQDEIEKRACGAAILRLRG